MKKIFSLIVFLVFVTCATPGFQIVNINDKFSDPTKGVTYLGKNNRLSSKSSQGGVHIDSQGVYLEPFVTKDEKDNIKEIGFYIYHNNFNVASGFLPIKEIIFLTDKNERISLIVENQNSDLKIHSWNNISETFNSSFSESGISFITEENFYKLASSKYIETKIIGGKMSQTYNKTEMNPDFIKNLYEFYIKCIKENPQGKY